MTTTPRDPPAPPRRLKRKQTRVQLEARRANMAKARAARRPNTEVTERMREAQRENVKHSTGPRTEEGKARTCRNAWKHGNDSRALRLTFAQSGAQAMAGLFGKPCKTTCPIHPKNPDVVSPCSLVLDGLTREGGNCLDKTVYVNALAALADAMENGSLDGMHAMLAAEGAKVMQLLHQMMEEISNKGLLIPVPIVTKDGEVVREEDGSITAMEYKPNPMIPAMIKLLGDFGITLPEMLATPQAKSKAKTAQSAGDSLQALMGSIMGRAALPKPPAALPPPLED